MGCVEQIEDASLGNGRGKLNRGKVDRLGGGGGGGGRGM